MSVGGSKSSSRAQAVIPKDLGGMRQDLIGNLNQNVMGQAFGPSLAASNLGPAMLLSMITGQDPSTLMQSGVFGMTGTPFQNIGAQPLPPSGYEVVDSKGNVIGTYGSEKEARRRAALSKFTEWSAGGLFGSGGLAKMKDFAEKAS